MTRPRWRQVTVIGCGLIGSSFALALRRNQICERILGWDVWASTLTEALTLGIIEDVDQSFSLGAISNSELIYLAIPVVQILEFLHDHGSHLSSGAIITDSGSTKRAICSAANEFLPANNAFVGGHPVAGSHESGPQYATHDLFVGTNYILTRDNSAPESEAFQRVRATIESIGSQVVMMAATEHDRIFALVSHLPQLLSSALGTTVAQQSDCDELNRLAGPAFKDMTRLAASSWSMWRDILATNPREISNALDLLLEKLITARDELHQAVFEAQPEFPALRNLFPKD